MPEGSRAYAGIGCHYMSQWMDRKTLGYTQMGGEGANWIGEAPFSNRGHVFQNLGDGTYNHSGYLAIRAAIASGVTMTYKILFNDAVAMTGGQANDGGLTVDQIARQVAAEGAKRVVVVTDEPWKYPSDTDWPRGLTIHHRDELDAVQRELATVPGVSVLIYDQTCAAEKRRRRKRGTFPDPRQARRHQRSGLRRLRRLRRQVELRLGAAADDRMGPQAHHRPVELQQGLFLRQGLLPVLRHRAWRQAEEGRERRRAGRLAGAAGAQLPLTNHPYGIIVTGVGGTGIVTIGAIIGMAAHLEGKGVGIIDMAGLAQKGGAVYSHIRIANTPERNSRHPRRRRRRRPGASAATSSSLGTKKVLGAIKQGQTRVVVNTAEFLPGDFTRNADFSLPTERLKRAIIGHAGREQSHFVDAGRLATALLGNSIGANMFMLGYAYQLGALPLSAEAIEKAIEMNGEAVAMNIAAFRYGRRAAVDPAAVEALVKPQPDTGERLAQALAIVRRDGRAPRRLPHRLSERALCAALPQLGREGPRGRSRKGARPMRAGRSGGALSVQADGLQGRIRGGAALHRHLLRRAGEVVLRRRQSALRIPSGAAAAGARATRRPASRRRCRSGRGC